MVAELLGAHRSITLPSLQTPGEGSFLRRWLVGRSQDESAAGTHFLFRFLSLDFIPGVVASADSGSTCQEATSDLEDS